LEDLKNKRKKMIL